MKKLTLLSLASLALAGIANVSAATWKVKNSLGRDICVTVNTGLSRIRRHIRDGEETPFISQACLYSVSIKEGSVKNKQTGKMISLRAKSGKARCPSGLPNIAKISIKEILDYNTVMLVDKGANIIQAQNKGKAILNLLKSEFEKAKKLCKNMSFEVINDNGSPKIILQGIKAQTQKAAPKATPKPTPPKQSKRYIDDSADKAAKEYNFYSALEISTTASPAQIKKAYFVAAKKYHPDKGGSKEKFQQINQAYEVLKNTDKKARYDKGLADGVFVQYQASAQPKAPTITPALPAPKPPVQKPTTPMSAPPVFDLETKETSVRQKPSQTPKKPVNQKPQSLLEEIRAGKKLKKAQQAEQQQKTPSELEQAIKQRRQQMREDVVDENEDDVWAAENN